MSVSFEHPTCRTDLQQVRSDISMSLTAEMSTRWWESIERTTRAPGDATFPFPRARSSFQENRAFAELTHVRCAKYHPADGRHLESCKTHCEESRRIPIAPGSY
jgi:hypothetical protein